MAPPFFGLPANLQALFGTQQGVFGGSPFGALSSAISGDAIAGFAGGQFGNQSGLGNAFGALSANPTLGAGGSFTNAAPNNALSAFIGNQQGGESSPTQNGFYQSHWQSLISMLMQRLGVGVSGNQSGLGSSFGALSANPGPLTPMGFSGMYSR